MIVKEHPILFSTPMVRAILDGQKTQTRRIVKGIINECPYKEGYQLNGQHLSNAIKQCPYGQVGDRLWVRETFTTLKDGSIKYKTDSFYKEADIYFSCVDGSTGKPVKWQPSIHMPRAASQILLEITNIRVERLQDISEEDCLSEGMANHCAGIDYLRHELPSAFKELWDSINAKKYSWASNPWVWCVSFKRI